MSECHTSILSNKTVKLVRSISSTSYFKTNLAVPTTKETGLSPRTLAEANKSVEQLFLASQSEEKQTKRESTQQPSLLRIVQTLGGTLLKTGT